MACFYPLDGYRAANRNESGKRSVVFNVRDGFADQPLSVPCGKCVGCTRDKALEWSIRCFHESLCHVQNSFVTLTYRNENLPADGRLDYAEIRRFLQRLRDDGNKVRYFGCGEYGGLTRRPHYHFLFFGNDFLDGANRFGNEDSWDSPYLDEIWGNGHCLIKPMQPESIFYTCGYTLKQQGDDDSFHVASRKPPLGSEVLEKHGESMAELGFITVKGRKYPIPRSYMNRAEEQFCELKERRKAHIRDRTPDDVWEGRRMLRGKEINMKAASSRKRDKI